MRNKTDTTYWAITRISAMALLTIFLCGGKSAVAQNSFCVIAPEQAADIFNPAELTAPTHPCRPKLFLIAGYLGEAEALYAVPEELRKNTRDKNAYDLALIRAGDPGRIDRLNRLLKTISVNDDFIYEVAPKLIYTRRREVMNFLFDAILDEARNCSPADSHTSGSINCAYRILELIAPVIREFPLEVGTSGDLTVTDYPAALALARSWIRENYDTYTIITDTY